MEEGGGFFLLLLLRLEEEHPSFIFYSNVFLSSRTKRGFRRTYEGVILRYSRRRQREGLNTEAKEKR